MDHYRHILSKKIATILVKLAFLNEFDETTHAIAQKLVYNYLRVDDGMIYNAFIDGDICDALSFFIKNGEKSLYIIKIIDFLLGNNKRVIEFKGMIPDSIDIFNYFINCFNFTDYSVKYLFSALGKVFCIDHNFGEQELKLIHGKFIKFIKQSTEEKVLSKALSSFLERQNKYYLEYLNSVIKRLKNLKRLDIIATIPYIIDFNEYIAIVKTLQDPNSYFVLFKVLRKLIKYKKDIINIDCNFIDIIFNQINTNGKTALIKLIIKYILNNDEINILDLTNWIRITFRISVFKIQMLLLKLGIICILKSHTEIKLELFYSHYINFIITNGVECQQLHKYIILLLRDIYQSLEQINEIPEFTEFLNDIDIDNIENNIVESNANGFLDDEALDSFYALKDQYITFVEKE